KLNCSKAFSASCGPGAMEAPMKGAAVGHAQQRYKDSRFIGMTEPSIIAAEPPNQRVFIHDHREVFPGGFEAFQRFRQGQGVRRVHNVVQIFMM
ncbi:hypothetical protein, partial [Klebsiella pneumoniae]|uniref:hypothetical protein n=1 Tax=Klebsiella pneumoniae TaxID=573 RepID=UPI0035C0D2DB|nr:hypothetical protein [Klebsiella pneumoniae]